MPDTEHLPPKKRTVRLQARALLMLLQLTLPFLLYLTLKWEDPVPAFLVAAVFVLSMLYLVWLG
ncbi:MAG: hypothetical protein K0B06_11265 [Brevefilum sp.]|nr:hypothetical protein [Brevefilum sp.]